MQQSNVLRRIGAKVGAGVGAVGLGMGSAMAAVPETVSTALTDAKADVTTIAGLAFTVFLAILVFAYFRRASK